MVLAILAFLSATVPVGLGVALPGMRLHSAARSLTTDLRAARTEALRDGRTILVRFDAAAPAYMVESKARSLPSASRLHWEGLAPGGGGAAIRFFPDGSSTGGVVELTQGSRTYHVAVDWLSGRVTIDD